MNDDEQKLDALTNQKVTLSLGGRSYVARRVSLYDLGLYNKRRYELEHSGDLGNLDMDSMVYLLWLLLKEDNPQFQTADDLARSLVRENVFDTLTDVKTALTAVGFQTLRTQKTVATETGA